MTSDITAVVVDLSDLSTSLATCENTRDRTFQENLSEAGAGSITFQNDDPDLAEMVLPNRLVNFYLEGVLAFTLLPETYEATDVSPNEEAELITVFSGRGHGALLDRVAIYPTLGVGRTPIEEDRAFNWPAISYDDSAWPNATELGTIDDGRLVEQAIRGYASPDESIVGFPDGDAICVWAAGGTFYFGRPLPADSAGTCRMRWLVTFPSDGLYSLFPAWDDFGEVYFDGQLLTTTEGRSFFQHQKWTMNVTAGEHLIAMMVVNGPNLEAWNPGGAAWTLYHALDDNNLGAFVAHSTGAGKIFEYADPPGMTPGQVILLMLGEAQARGAIPYITCSFDAVNDTNGDPWPDVTDIATKVGTTLLTFLRELSATYIDWSMTPGTTELNAWVKGGRDTAPAISYHAVTDPTDPLSGNLLSKVRKGEV